MLVSTYRTWPTRSTNRTCSPSLILASRGSTSPVLWLAMEPLTGTLIQTPPSLTLSSTLTSCLDLSSNNTMTTIATTTSETSIRCQSHRNVLRRLRRSRTVPARSTGMTCIARTSLVHSYLRESQGMARHGSTARRGSIREAGKCLSTLPGSSISKGVMRSPSLAILSLTT